MKRPYIANTLPLAVDEINQSYFFEELIDATTKLELYKEKIKDSKLDSSWFMPTLQQKEALASSMMEGTQATLDGVLINQIFHNDKDENLNEVQNYYLATLKGYDSLKKRDFSNELIFDLHTLLMLGKVRKPKLIGEYRDEQNFIGHSGGNHEITFIPPVSDDVPKLMDNLINYMNNPNDNFRPLVRAAIIHAQFETIHPFMDGNGRVGRILIPLYLYSQKQIELPCFFISESLERDKIKYYNLLNNIRTKNDWNEWIKFFLSTVTKQCNKYINMVTDINALYDRHMKDVCEITKSSNSVEIINSLFKSPITTAKEIAEITNLPMTSINRCLSKLIDEKILYTDNKKRNRTYYYFELLDLVRS